MFLLILAAKKIKTLFIFNYQHAMVAGGRYKGESRKTT
jgi:hypothetical protein